MIDDSLLEILRCPVTGTCLRLDGSCLINADGSQRYAVVDGIPMLISPLLSATHSGYQHVLDENNRELHAGQVTDQELDDFLDHMVKSTCGNLFSGVKLRGDYPLGSFPQFNGGTILDVGCNWGRWAIAGAASGQRVVGVDIHLRSLRLARFLAQKISPENMPQFVLADARQLPFADETVSGVFSYSVLQHLSRENAGNVLDEFGRMMPPGAECIVQMPNKRGVYSTIKRLMHGVRDEEYNVRYYEISELLEQFNARIGQTTWNVDCFLGLNVHARDMRFVPWSKRWIVVLNEALLGLSNGVRPLARWADSIFLHARKA